MVVLIDCPDTEMSRSGNFGAIRCRQTATDKYDCFSPSCAQDNLAYQRTACSCQECPNYPGLTLIKYLTCTTCRHAPADTLPTRHVVYSHTDKYTHTNNNILNVHAPSLPTDGSLFFVQFIPLNRKKSLSRMQMTHAWHITLYRWHVCCVVL